MEVNACAGDAESKGNGVFAVRSVRAGDTVLHSSAQSVSAEGRTNRTVQVALRPQEVHINLDDVSSCLNHCCEPNTAPITNQLGAYDFIALRDIARGDEINFDYETTEWTVSISVPEGGCNCGAAGCRRDIKGGQFRSDLLETYSEKLPDWVKNELDGGN